MIAKRACSTQFSKFAAERLARGNSRRSPSVFTRSLASVSTTASPSLSPSSRPKEENGSRTYSNTKRRTYQPMGDLFQYAKQKGSSKSNSIVEFLGKTASISRVFGPASNAQALLTCGGEELAQQASFDPDYETAKGWIRSRPVGPAVLSSTLISGLVGALIEASFPQTVPVNNSMNFSHPLIVGMEVEAAIKVESVRQTKRDGSKISTSGGTNGNGQNGMTDMGYEILLSTQVTRVQDDVTIAEGHHTVWIPGYL